MSKVGDSKPKEEIKEAESKEVLALKEKFHHSYIPEKNCYISLAQVSSFKSKIALNQQAVVRQYYESCISLLQEDQCYLSDHLLYFENQKPTIDKLGIVYGENPIFKNEAKYPSKANNGVIRYLKAANTSIATLNSATASYKAQLAADCETLNTRKEQINIEIQKLTKEELEQTNSLTKELNKLEDIINNIKSQAESKETFIVEGKDQFQDTYVAARLAQFQIKLIASLLEKQKELIFGKEGLLAKTRALMQDSHLLVHQCDERFIKHSQSTIWAVPINLSSSNKNAENKFQEFSDQRIRGMFEGSKANIEVYSKERILDISTLITNFVNISASSEKLEQSFMLAIEEAQKAYIIDQIMYCGDAKKTNGMAYLVMTKAKYLHIFENEESSAVQLSFDLLGCKYSENDNVFKLSDDDKKIEFSKPFEDTVNTQIKCFCTKE